MIADRQRSSRRAAQASPSYFGVGRAGSTPTDALPILSAASVGTPAAGAFNGANVTTTVPRGMLYWAVVTNGGTATDAQIIAGSGGNIVAGKAGSQGVTATGVNTIPNISGLTGATTFQILFLQINGAGDHSAQASASGTTL